MTEIIVKEGWAESVQKPETVMEVSTHPVSGHKGRFVVRTGRPMQRWNRQKHRMEWVQQTEVERVDKAHDGAIFMLVNDGFMSSKDFDEMSQEAAERRGTQRRNKPLIAPKPSYIEEACKQVFLRDAESYTVEGITFTRPSVGLLIPRNAEWAHAMAEESKAGWHTSLRRRR